MKKIFVLMAAVFIVAACAGPVADQQTADEQIEYMAIAELVSEPLMFENKTVSFEGIIDHMCRHSGDKMRVAQLDNDQMSIQVRLGEFMNYFSLENEGNIVSIVGTMHTEVLNMEELEKHDAGHDCESTEEAIALMAERGIDPNIRSYIKLTAFEMK
ncbi:MAG: hypothetical protein EA394_10585 [Bacteroidia bacterium]|nr:MAG: hypothetical protein EA394_10585 [Bacteroidia bacterium]